MVPHLYLLIHDLKLVKIFKGTCTSWAIQGKLSTVSSQFLIEKCEIKYKILICSKHVILK